MSTEEKKLKSWFVVLKSVFGSELTLYVHAYDAEHALTVAQNRAANFIRRFCPYSETIEREIIDKLDSDTIIEIK